MAVERFDEFMKAQPFRAFDVNLANGDSVRVMHPEFAARSPNGRTVAIFTPDDRMKVIDLLLVTDLEHANGSRGSRAGKKRK